MNLLQTYRRTIVICILIILIPFPAAAATRPPHDFQRLLGFIKGGHKQAPLVLLNDRQGEFDRRLNRENLAYLNDNQSLLADIRNRLEADSLQWRLAGSAKRLWVIPETRDEAELFERYCREAVDYALDLTRLPDPYLQIATFDHSGPLTAAPEPKGVTAYLVHKIADEYIEEYLFFKQENARSKIKIKLSNRTFSGRIGAYTSNLTFGPDRRIEFVHDPYTIWQNSAKNPINALVAPIEETLHISLRNATETAIRAKLARIQADSLQVVRKVVDEWMALEEAIVGGLVSKLMPEIFTRLFAGSFEEEMAAALAERDIHDRYRYLPEGLRIVTDLGVQPAVALYTSEPLQFKQLITPAESACTESLP